MDRREAIRELKFRRENSISVSEIHALDLAIKALEREIEYGQMVVDFTKGETMKSDEWKYDTTCDAESATTTDCIGREQAIEEIGRWLGYLDEDMIARIRIGIRNLPPVTPTERTGEWIRRKDGGATCSRCGVMLGKGHWTNCDGIPDYYCYNCGAKMGGDSE